MKVKKKADIITTKNNDITLITNTDIVAKSLLSKMEFVEYVNFKNYLLEEAHLDKITVRDRLRFYIRCKYATAT